MTELKKSRLDDTDRMLMQQMDSSNDRFGLIHPPRKRLLLSVSRQWLALFGLIIISVHFFTFFLVPLYVFLFIHYVRLTREWRGSLYSGFLLHMMTLFFLTASLLAAPFIRQQLLLWLSQFFAWVR